MENFKLLQSGREFINQTCTFIRELKNASKTVEDRLAMSASNKT